MPETTSRRTHRTQRRKNTSRQIEEYRIRKLIKKILNEEINKIKQKENPLKERQCEYVNLKNHNASNSFGEYNLSEYKWSFTKINWFFKDTDDRKKNGITMEEIKKDLRKAFNRWRTWSPLRFVETKNESNAEIVIQFNAIPPRNLYNGKWKRSTLAVGFYPDPDAGSIAGDIHVNSTLKWRSKSITQSKNINWQNNWYDFFSMIVHEIGHAVGIKHSGNPSAIMAPMYKLLNPPYNLHEDDRNAIIQSYGTSSFSSKLVDRIAYNRK